MDRRKNVAAIVTEYRHWSHAELLVGKILEGYLQDGGPGPELRLVSMYVDQFHSNDLSRQLAKKYGFTLYDSIAATLTRGGKELAVDGVLIVGEHGAYPTNALGQILYPRRKWFEEAIAVMARSGRVVPVFNDKHLASSWADAKWMYDKAREMKVPFLAGSSLPLTWRRPELELPRNCELDAALQIGYGPFDTYGFHALEALQCMVERRKGGETGVAAVQCLQGEAIWKSAAEGRWSTELFDALLAMVTYHNPGDVRAVMTKAMDAAVWLIQYRDGLRGAVIVPNGWLYECDGGSFFFAARLKGQRQPVRTQFYMQQPEPFAHFAYQVRAIEHLVRTGHSPIPIERTLLTTGMLEALHISRHEKQRRVATPHLAITYQPSDWPHATGAVPKGR